MIASLIAGAALAAPIVAAQSFAPDSSFVSCSITGSGLAGSQSQEVATEVVGIASEFLCGGRGNNINRAAIIAAGDIANATAFAIASASASCFASGRSSFQINGRSAAGAEAVAVAEAIIDLAATVEVCGECSVAAALWARSYEKIIINASAEAEIAFSGQSMTGDEPLEIRAGDFEAQFVQAAADATVDALLVLRGAVDEGCSATILADIGSDVNGVECAVRASGEAISVSRRATAFAARAATAIAAKPCGIEVETTVEVAVSQVAEAVAIAIAGVEANCLIAGDAYVCALVEAEITATANATAFAFAAAYAEETETCGAEVCTLRAAALAEVIQTVIIRATSALYLQQCSGPDTFFDISIFQASLAEVILAPFIEIIDQIQVVSGRCSVVVPVFAIPGESSGNMEPGEMEPMAPPPPTCAEECSADNRACAGRGFDTPAACCSPDYVCIRRDDDFSQCRLNGVPGTRQPWDGREEVCVPRE